MRIDHLETEQDWQNGTTRYWFEVDGEGWCVCDEAGELTLLDSEGYPVEECNAHDGIKEALMPHYEKQRAAA